jgi:hypothetical protein
MGCDVHCFAEVKYKGRWQFAGEVYMERHYDIFSKMANVRNEEDSGIEPISLPRGVPQDASDLTKVIMDDVDYHSHSYLSLEEMKALDEWVESAIGPFFKWNYIKWPWGVMTDALKPKFEQIEDIRFVFAFDN